nr:sodium/proline symporter PutP [Kineosphaera limosa]
MLVYMLAMLAIGWWSYHRTTDLDDYMLGGRDLSPSVAALSAGASDMSGWLLMGLPGAVYAAGLVEGWIAVGLTVGAWVNWKVVAPRLRAYTEIANNSITVPSFLENRLHDRSRALRIASGAIILVFFTFYVSSGMVAGGVFFQGSFGWDYHLGMVFVASVTVAYTLFGGFLAVSYTDLVQGIMMVSALIAVPTLGLVAVGGPGEMVRLIREVDPQHFSMVNGATFIGVVSSLAWGLGYFGQPHIIVRFMALRSPQEATAGRRIGIAWMLFSVVGAVMTALVGIAYVQSHPEMTISDPETIYLRLGQALFHPLVAGFMLAAVLAAIMSTVSSQLLVTSSALVEDLYKAMSKTPRSDSSYVMMGRMAVLTVSLVAAAMAWNQNDTILGLVAFAWAGFGASFGPIILLALYWRRLTTAGAFAGMVTGAVVVWIWASLSDGPGDIFNVYEILPGFLANLAVAVGLSIATYKPDSRIREEFDASVRVSGKHVDREPIA